MHAGKLHPDCSCRKPELSLLGGLARGQTRNMGGIELGNVFWPKSQWKSQAFGSFRTVSKACPKYPYIVKGHLKRKLPG